MSFIKKSKYRISLLLVLALVVQLAGPILANYAYADDDLGSQAEQETPSEEEINEDEDEDLPSPEEEEGEEDPEGDAEVSDGEGETEDDLDNPDDEGDSDTPPEDEDQKKEEIEEEVQIDDPKVDIPQEEPMIGPKAQGDITIFSGGEVFQFITNVSITDLDGMS